MFFHKCCIWIIKSLCLFAVQRLLLSSLWSTTLQPTVFHSFSFINLQTALIIDTACPAVWNVEFLSPPVHFAWWAHMRRFLSVRLSGLDQKSDLKIIHISESIELVWALCQIHFKHMYHYKEDLKTSSFWKTQNYRCWIFFSQFRRTILKLRMHTFNTWMLFTNTHTMDFLQIFY